VSTKYPLPADVNERTAELRRLWKECRKRGECVVCAKRVFDDERFAEFVEHFAEHSDLSVCEDVIVWFSYGPYRMRLVATTEKCAICAHAGPLIAVHKGLSKFSVFHCETAKLEEYRRLEQIIGKLQKKVAEYRRKQNDIRRQLKRKFPETLLEDI